MAPPTQAPPVHRSIRIKLGDAASLIADRLRNSNASDSDSNEHLVVAREQLIQALFDEELSAEGLLFYKDSTDVGEWPIPKQIEWFPIKSPLWSNRKCIDKNVEIGNSKLDTIEINWKTHSYTWIEEVKSLASIPTGVCEIRLLQEDIDRIWPAPPSEPTVLDQPYETAWLRLMREAITHFEITEENQPGAKVLREWFSFQQAGGLKISAHAARALTTFVRLPEKMRGGNTPSPRREDLPRQG